MYQLSHSRVTQAYISLNRQLFHNTLPAIRHVCWHFGDLPVWAECQVQNQTFQLWFVRQYPSRSFWLNILAHELAHIHTWQRWQTLTHGSRFFSLRPWFESQGFLLQREY